MSGFFNRIVNTIPAPKTTLASGGSQMATPTTAPASQVAPQLYAQQPQQQAPQPTQAPQPQQQGAQPAQAGQAQPQAPAKPFSDAFNQPTPQNPVNEMNPVTSVNTSTPKGDQTVYSVNDRDSATVVNPQAFKTSADAYGAWQDYNRKYQDAINANGGRADEFILDQVNNRAQSALAYKQYQDLLAKEAKAQKVAQAQADATAKKQAQADALAKQQAELQANLEASRKASQMSQGYTSSGGTTGTGNSPVQNTTPAPIYNDNSKSAQASTLSPSARSDD